MSDGMDPIFAAFWESQQNQAGYDLSATLSPVAPPTQPARLHNFYRSTNFANAKNDFKYRILYDNSSPFKLTPEEGNAWVEVYLAYWKAVGEILDAEAASKANSKVRNHKFL